LGKSVLKIANLGALPCWEGSFFIKVIDKMVVFEEIIISLSEFRGFMGEFCGLMSEFYNLMGEFFPAP
jgi:hypothetical protein